MRDVATLDLTDVSGGKLHPGRTLLLVGSVGTAAAILTSPWWCEHKRLRELPTSRAFCMSAH